MAEAYLKKLAADKFEVESAGLEKGVLNPLAVEAMKEENIDISNNLTKKVDDFFATGKSFEYVITVCDPKASESCPIFPGMKKINWAFDDPSKFEGSYEEKLQQTRNVRNQIKSAVMDFIKEYSN